MKLVYHIATATVVGVLVGPTMWMLMDRDPPYLRESGEVIPVDYRMCGLESGPPMDGMIHPGSCLEVRWTIIPLRTCKPSGPYNVTRAISDQGGLHPLPSANSVYSAKSATLPPHGIIPEGDIIRYFALPPHGPLGPAKYHSAASFACNKLQEYFRPIVVDEPDIPFLVGELPRRGPQ